MGDILSLGGTVPALISSSSQKDINKWNINAQQQANEQNIALNREMFDKQVQANKEAEQRAFINQLEMTRQKNQMGLEMLDYVYNKYQSPKARAEALRKAGFNPSAMLSNASGAFGNVSAPQAAEGAVASYGSPNLQAAHVDAPQIQSNPDSYLMQGYDSVVNAISKVSESKKNDAETVQTLTMLTDTLKSLRLKNITQDLINQSMEFDLALNKAFKEKDVVASINLKFAEAGRAYEAGNLDKARASVAAAEEIMIKNTNALNAPLVRNAELLGKLVVRSYEDNHNLALAGVVEKRAAAAEHYAGAEEKHANALTIDGLRQASINSKLLENKELSAKIRSINVQTLDKAVETIDRAFGYDSGIASYIKSIMVGLDASEREKAIGDLLRSLDK